MKVRISMLAVGVLVAAGLVAAPPSAFAASDASSAEPIVMDEQVLIDSLNDSGIELEGIDYTDDGMALTTQSELGDGSNLTATTSIDIENNTFTMQLESDDPAIDGSVLSLEISSATTTSVEFTATDVETGQEIDYDSEAGQFSILPAVLAVAAALGISAVAAQILLALLLSAAVIVVAGVLYYSFTAVAKAIRDGSPINHWAVDRLPNGLGFLYSLTLNQAVSRGLMGGDTWSASPTGAYTVAKNIKSGRIPVGPERDAGGSGKYMHYHPFNRTPAMHAFFGNPN